MTKLLYLQHMLNSVTLSGFVKKKIFVKALISCLPSNLEAYCENVIQIQTPKIIYFQKANTASIFPKISNYSIKGVLHNFQVCLKTDILFLL